jgi:hypothetical protein
METDLVMELVTLKKELQNLGALDKKDPANYDGVFSCSSILKCSDESKEYQP